MAEMIAWTSLLDKHGPDHMFQIKFLDGTGKFVKEKIAGLTLPAFQRIAMTNAVLSTGNIGLFEETAGGVKPVQVSSFDLYVDIANANQFLVNLGLKEGQSNNLWSYKNFAVHETGLWIEHGNGSTDENSSVCEAMVLHEVLDCPQLSIGEWTILSGGDGYDSVVGAQGKGKEALQQSLKCPAKSV